MKTTLIKGIAVAALTVFGSVAANASAVYNVSSTSVINCGSAAHGLWTNNVNISSSGCGNYYDMLGGSLFTLFNDDTNSANWTATLVGSSINPAGVVASINLTLSDFAEVAAYKQEFGAAYDAGTDTPDIDFFQNIAGTISFDDGNTIQTYTVDPSDPVPGGLNFQYGLGANGKDPNAFGASVWLNMLDPNGYLVSGHWDINVDLELTDNPNEVPEPAGLALLGLGTVALGAMRRRKAA